MEGRYLNIVIPGRREYLTLCEVEVTGQALGNTAPTGDVYHLTLPIDDVEQTVTFKVQSNILTACSLAGSLVISTHVICLCIP